MTFPKIKHPIFAVNVPSTGKTINMRPWLTHEEKILLMAKEGEEPTSITRAMLQVMNNCCVDEGVDITQLYGFDFDSIFVQLRALSVDNIVTVTVQDAADDEKKHTIAVNLDHIKVVVDKKALTRVVDVDGDLKIRLKYPTVAKMFELTDVIETLDNKEDVSTALILGCLDGVFNAEEEFQAESDEEILTWVKQLPKKTTQAIQQFLDEIPTLTHTIKVKHTDGEEREVVLRGINDFFIL